MCRILEYRMRLAVFCFVSAVVYILLRSKISFDIDAAKVSQRYQDMIQAGVNSHTDHAFRQPSLTQDARNSKVNIQTVPSAQIADMHRNQRDSAVLIKRSQYELFQPAEEVDFPTVDTATPRIPHIIHQMYTDVLIPEIYREHVKSFIKNNPSWEYRFWTDESGRKLIENNHPYLLNVYDRFGSNVKRSDLLRYVVLYEFGGFYADLDVDNLRSLNRTTMKYACIVSVEPFEHSVLLNRMEFLMNNAIMSCRPKHPFFKKLLFNLQHVNPSGYPVGTTGPGFVTRMFNSYNNMEYSQHERKTDMSSNSPYFYKGKFKEDDENAVYVPNSQYFMDELDPIHVKKDGQFTKRCSSIDTLPDLLSKRACTEFHTRKTVRENKKYTFTVHHWYHLWEMKRSSVGEMKKIDIRQIVPNCILYDGENFTSYIH